MKIEGIVVEMGDLDGFATPTPGLRIEIGEQIVEISGLTRGQIKAIPPVMFRKIALTLDAT
jgi:hypothetical protein